MIGESAQLTLIMHNILASEETKQMNYYHGKKTKPHSAYKMNRQKSTVLLCANTSWPHGPLTGQLPTHQLHDIGCECEQDGSHRVTALCSLIPQVTSHRVSHIPFC